MGKRPVQTTRIAVRRALQICFVGYWTTSNVGEGRPKSRCRHNWRIKPHHQLRYVHEFKNGSKLNLGGGCVQVVMDRSDTFPDSSLNFNLMAHEKLASISHLFRLRPCTRSDKRCSRDVRCWRRQPQVGW